MKWLIVLIVMYTSRCINNDRHCIVITEILQNAFHTPPEMYAIFTYYITKHYIVITEYYTNTTNTPTCTLSHFLALHP